MTPIVELLAPVAARAARRREKNLRARGNAQPAAATNSPAARAGLSIDDFPGIHELEAPTAPERTLHG